MSEHNFPTPDFITLGKEIKKGMFIIAERECLAFFKESFDKGGFTDVSFQKWEDRKQPDYRTGGALLNATGFLKDSIEVAKKDSNSITFGSYAKFWGYSLNNLNFVSRQKNGIKMLFFCNLVEKLIIMTLYSRR